MTTVSSERSHVHCPHGKGSLLDPLNSLSVLAVTYQSPAWEGMLFYLFMDTFIDLFSMCVYRCAYLYTNVCMGVVPEDIVHTLVIDTGSIIGRGPCHFWLE